MKQELFFLKVLTKILESNENYLEYFLYSLKFVDKYLILMYHDCARIYIFDQYDDSIKVKSYYTENYTSEKRNSETLEFEGQKPGEPQNKINFQQFIINNPMDKENSHYFEKEYKYTDLE